MSRHKLTPRPLESTSFKSRNQLGKFIPSRGKRIVTEDTPDDVIWAFNYASATKSKKILLLLQRQGPWTKAELAGELSKSEKTSTKAVSLILQELKDLGLAVKANGGWNRHDFRDF